MHFVSDKLIHALQQSCVQRPTSQWDPVLPWQSVLKARSVPYIYSAWLSGNDSFLSVLFHTWLNSAA